MKRTIVPLLALLLIGCSRHKQTVITSPIVSTKDTQISVTNTNDTSIVSKEILGIIKNCSYANWYLLDAKKSDFTGYNYEKVDTLAHKTDSLQEHISALYALLSYHKSFEKKEYFNECTFFPDVAIEFVQKEDTVIMEYSFYCDICRFRTQELLIDYDGDNIHGQIVTLFSEVFPNDKFLRNLKK